MRLENIEKVILINNLYKSILPTKRDKEKGFVDNKKSKLQIGRSNEGSTGDYGLFTGKMDEFRFYNEELTEFEVKTIYQKTLGNDNPIEWQLVKKHLIKKEVKEKVSKKIKDFKNDINKQLKNFK